MDDIGDMRLEPPFGLTDEELAVLADYLRQKVFETCQQASSGHIGGSSSAVELMTALYFGGILAYSPKDPRHPWRDRVLVRGHLGPVRYPLFSLFGWIREDELGSYRKLGSRLHGHEDWLETPGVDLTPSGSLGMLLSYGVGSALSARDRGLSYLTYVFIGDGEEQEGNVSEAARHAAHLGLTNLIAIIDCNGKQLSDPVQDVDSASLETLWRGYGWNVIALSSGHSIRAVREAYREAARLAQIAGRPTVIIADTVKGIGLEGAEQHFSGYHTTSTCSAAVIERAIEGFRERSADNESVLNRIRKQILEAARNRDLAPASSGFYPVSLGFRLATDTPNHPDRCQAEYFRQLEQACREGVLRGEPVYFLTADVTRRDQVGLLRLREFTRYHNVGIREQHTIALAHGLSLTDPSARILINSFDAFMYRWLDQVNAAVQGKSSMVIIADVAGLTNAQNGKTHQTSGQPGAVLMLPGIAFLEPWDAEDTFGCLNWAIGESRGVVYLRVHSSSITESPQGEIRRNLTCYTVWEPEKGPDIVLVGSGMAVDSAIGAALRLREKGVAARVVNLINHKDPGPALKEAIVHGRPLLTVYNGAAAVLEANVARALFMDPSVIPSRIVGLGYDFGTTGSFEDLRRHYGLDAESVAAKAAELVRS